MKTILIASALTLLAIAGCASSNKPAAAAAAATTSKPVNKYCIIMDEHPVRADAQTTVMYKGQAVGFCCEDCIDGWQKMSDAQKDAALKKAIAAK
jgi:hypothetical protein